MSTSCIEFKNKNFWENDIIICLTSFLIINSSQKKTNWMKKYFKNVLGKILIILPIGTASFKLDVYFEKYYKRYMYIKYLENIIKEFELNKGGVFSNTEINTMLSLSGRDLYPDEAFINKEHILKFITKLIDLLDIK